MNAESEMTVLFESFLEWSLVFGGTFVGVGLLGIASLCVRDAIFLAVFIIIDVFVVFSQVGWCLKRKSLIGKHSQKKGKKCLSNHSGKQLPGRRHLDLYHSKRERNDELPF